MKTKQKFIRAAFTTEQSRAKNLNGSKELIRRIVLVCRKTEAVVIDCRLYLGGSTVHSALWVNIHQSKKPDGWEYAYTSGAGRAGGCGYHKESAAVADALKSASIELYGSPYGVECTRADMKKRAHIGGCGDESIRLGLLAVAHAAGFTDCIVVG